MSDTRSSTDYRTPRTPHSILQNGVLNTARSSSHSFSPYPAIRPNSARLDDPNHSVADSLGISLPSSAVVAALYKEREENRKLLHQLREQTLDATTPRFVDEASSWKIFDGNATSESCVSRPSSARWSATSRDGRFSRDLGSARGSVLQHEASSPALTAQPSATPQLGSNLSLPFFNPTLASSIGQQQDTSSSSSLQPFETPPRRSHWLEAALKPDTQRLDTQRSERGPIPAKTLLHRRNEGRMTPRVPSVAIDSNEQSAARDKILTMAKIQLQLEAALEEERTKRHTRDAQIHELRKQRDKLAAKCISLEAQVQALSVIDSSAPRPSDHPQDNFLRACQENKAIKAVLEEVCNSLQLMKEENDRLRRQAGSPAVMADTDEADEADATRFPEGEALFSPALRDADAADASGPGVGPGSGPPPSAKEPVGRPAQAARTPAEAAGSRAVETPSVRPHSSPSSAQPQEALRRDVRVLEQEVLRESAERVRLVLELENARRAVQRAYAAVQQDAPPPICGVGLRLATAYVKSKGVVRVEEVVSGGAAEASGVVRANDFIVAVDERPVSGLTFEQIHKLIAGPEGSSVTIRGRHTEQGPAYEVTLQRTATTKPPTSGEDMKSCAAISEKICIAAAALHERMRGLQGEVDRLQEQLARQRDEAARTEKTSAELRGAVSELDSTRHFLESEKRELEQRMRGHEMESICMRQEGLPRDCKTLAAVPQAGAGDSHQGPRGAVVDSAQHQPEAVSERDRDAGGVMTIGSPERDLCGVGLSITESSPYRVLSCKPGGAADRSGDIRVGDILVSVDGTAVAALSFAEVRALIMGKSGTQVNMKFERGRAAERKQVSISMIRSQSGVAERDRDTPSRPGASVVRAGSDASRSGNPSTPNCNSAYIEDLQAAKSGLDEAVKALAERDVALKQSAALSAELEKVLALKNTDGEHIRKELEEAREALWDMHAAICDENAEAKLLAGVGLRLAASGVAKGPFRVQEVVSGGSASLSGVIKANDLLLSVDGKTVPGLSMAQVNDLIQGPVGSPVKIKGQHGDRGAQYEVTLNRKAPASQVAKPSSNAAPSQHRSLVTEACATAAALRAELNQLKHKVALLESEATERSAELESIRSALELAKAAQSASDVRLQAAVARNADLSSQNSELEVGNKELSALLNSLESEKAAIEQRLRGKELEVLRARISTPEKPIQLPERSMEDDWDARSCYSSITESSPGNEACGVGLRLTETTPFRVKNCVPNGPAHKTGEIRPDDVLLAVDGVSVVGKSFSEVRRLILGRVGTIIEMQFLRSRGEERKNFNVSMVRSASGPAKEGASRPNSGSRPGSQNLSRDELSRVVGTPRPGSSEVELQAAKLRADEAARAVLEKDATIKNLTALSQELDRAMNEKNEDYKQICRDLEESRKCIQVLYDAVCKENAEHPVSAEVGLRLSVVDGGKGIIRVEEVVAGGSAALSAVIRPKDTISSINGMAVHGLTVSQLHDLLKGPVGTYVKIKGQHEDKGEEYEVSILRLVSDSEKNAVPIEIVLDKKLRDIPDMDIFAGEFLMDIANATSLKPHQIHVSSIVSGSVVVNVLISADENRTPSESAKASKELPTFVQELENQMKKATSKLMQGMHTCSIKSVKRSAPRDGKCVFSGAVVSDGKVRGRDEFRFWKSRTAQACATAAMLHNKLNSIKGDYFTADSREITGKTHEATPSQIRAALARIQELESTLADLRSSRSNEGSDKGHRELADTRKELDHLRAENQEMARRLLKKEDEDWETKSTFSTFSGESESSTGPDNCGVGLRVTETPPYKVRGCFAGSPAHRSGEIRPGDRLLSVDGVATSQLPIGELRKMIVGRAGSKVEMQFLRSRGDERRTFTVSMIRSSNEVFGKTTSLPRDVGGADDSRIKRGRLDESAKLLASKDEALQKLTKLSAELEKTIQEKNASEELLTKELQIGQRCIESLHSAITTKLQTSVGLRFSRDGGDQSSLRIGEIHAGSSASGILRINDIVMAVDGKPVSNLTNEQVYDLIDGREGTSVQIKGQHENDGTLFLVSLKRQILAHARADSQSERLTPLDAGRRQALTAEGCVAAAALQAEIRTLRMKMSEHGDYPGRVSMTIGQSPDKSQLPTIDKSHSDLEAARKDLEILRAENQEMARRLARQHAEEDEWETKSAYSVASGESEAISGAGPDACGVGLRITDTAPYRVRGCVAGGPAHKTGDIRAGDTLLAVDGVAVAQLPIAEIRKKIVGKAGSKIEMQFQRARGDERRTFNVCLVRARADERTSSRVDGRSAPSARPQSLDLSRGAGKDGKGREQALGDELRILKLRLDETAKALAEKDKALKKLESSSSESEKAVHDLTAVRDRMSKELEEGRQAVQFLLNAIYQGGIRKCGVGLLLSLSAAGKGPWHVEQVIGGSAAATSGVIHVKDIILAVDGKLLAGLTLEQVHALIEGPEGTSVKIKGQHGESGVQYEVTLDRELTARQSPRGRSPRADMRNLHVLTAEGCSAAMALHTEVRDLHVRLKGLADEVSRREEELGKMQRSLEQAQAALSRAESGGASARGGGDVREAEETRGELEALRAENQEMARRLARQHAEEDEWETKSAYSVASGESEAISGAGPDACGVGLRITDTAPYRVRGCVAGGPAHKTGDIRAGDTLLAVDGVAVAQLPIAEIRKKIVGKAGSKIEMQFQRTRGDERRKFTVSMTRAPAEGRGDKKAVLSARPQSLDLSRGGGSDWKERERTLTEEVRALKARLEEAGKHLAEKDEALKKLVASSSESERAAAESVVSRDRLSKELEEARQSVQRLHDSVVRGGAACACGVGLLLARATTAAGKGVFRVEQVVTGGSAAASGVLKPKDTIHAVDGREVAGLSLAQVHDLIEGPEGSVVKLTGQHGEQGADYEVSLAREFIGRQDVRVRHDKADEVVWRALVEEGCAAAAALHVEVKQLKELKGNLAQEIAQREKELGKLQRSLEEAQAALGRADTAGSGGGGKETEALRGELESARRDLEALRAENQEMARRLARQLRSDEDLEAKSGHSVTSGESEASVESSPDACGVGLRITDTAPYRVRGCVPGGPADATREIRTGDTLLAVNGQQVAQLPLADVRRLIVGAAGTRLVAQFQRSSGDERRTFDVPMVRALAAEAAGGGAMGRRGGKRR